MWRVSIYILLFLMFVATARAEEQKPYWFQRPVIAVDRVCRRLHKQTKLPRINKYLDKRIPLDDFKVTFKPKVAKSVRKGEIHFVIGFKFTF